MWIKFRLWLVKKIDPWPDKGEGWCIGCSLSGGRTLVLSEGGARSHIEQHRNTEGLDAVAIRTRSYT
jgi:hypothetical protein